MKYVDIMSSDEKFSSCRKATAAQNPNSPGAAISPPDTAYRSGVRIIPPAVYAIVFGVGFLLQRRFPIAMPLEAFGRLATMVLLIASALLGAWSLICFWRAHTSPLPIRPSTTLVITGPYRFIRNPMYLSLFFLYVGLALRFGTVWALIVLPVATVIIRYYIIAREEKYLERRFGTEYLDYKVRVPRWFPRLRRKINC